MSLTLFSEVRFPLQNLIQAIELGEIGLPEIQRPFVWKNTKVRDLFDSMYRGYPVGYFLFWATDAGNAQRAIGTEAKQKAPRLLIVDGQQRLTSLYTVIKGVPVVRHDYRHERIHIAFCPKDQRFEVADAAIRKDPEFIDDIGQLWSPEIGYNRFVKEFILRLRERREVSDEEEDRLADAMDRLRNLQTYSFTVLELSQKVTEEQVAEVFVRINSQGTPLKQADFILTLMSVWWDEGRSELEHFCRDCTVPSMREASPFNHFMLPGPDQMLRVDVALGFRRARLQHVYSILRGKDLKTGHFSEERREEQFGVLKQSQGRVLNIQDWHDHFKSLVQAGYRQSSMIMSQVALLYNYALYLIGRHDFGVAPYRLREIMARWFFMVSLTRRYTGSPESIMEEDLARLNDVSDAGGFVAALDGIIRTVSTEDFWNIGLPSELVGSSARTPTLFAYDAALNILGAKALFSRITVAELFDPATKAKKSPVERHHIFPKGYLKGIGITRRRDTNQMANYALVEWSDNIKISNRPPAEYMPEYFERFSADDAARMRYWHALPEDWGELDYTGFLDFRRQAIAKVIRDAYRKLSGDTDE